MSSSLSVMNGKSSCLLSIPCVRINNKSNDMIRYNKLFICPFAFRAKLGFSGATILIHKILSIFKSSGNVTAVPNINALS